MHPAPEDPAPTAAELARHAWEQGQDKLARGDAAGAARWLDRARRLAPADPTVRLALASSLLQHDPTRAAGLLAGLADRHDTWEVHLGRAAAHWRLDDRAAAARALAAALSRHVAPADASWAGLADAIAPDGWCAITAGGRLRIGPGHRPGIAIALDGSRHAGSRLPGRWRRADRLDVSCHGQALLGSPIDLAALRRVEGAVQWRAGRITGWAWHPADPARPVTLTIQPSAGPARHVAAKGRMAMTAATGLLSRPSGFALRPPASPGAVAVLGDDGRHLAGSPVHPGEPGPATPARPPPRTTPRRRGIAIVIPVHGGGATVRACLDSVLAARAPDTRVIVVDDATPDRDLAGALAVLARRPHIRLIRHTEARGFPAAANAGMAVAGGRDVLLLNSDTLVPPGFAERLQQAAHTAPDIATACPLSNNASILSYPTPVAATPMPTLAETRRRDAQASRACRGAPVPIPTPVGFCMLIRHDALRRVGAFRADVFGRGYGEENDFAMRARAAGWRHVAAPDVFVAHQGEASFGPAAAALRHQASAILARLHPDYQDLVADHAAADPLADARRRLDLARWRSARRNAVRGAAPGGGRAVLLLTHRDGGGVARAVAERCAALRAAGLRPILLRPAHPRPSHQRPSAAPVPGVAVDDGSGLYPNLCFRLPEERPALLRLLRGERPARMEVHHTLGHAPDILDLPRSLDIPFDVIVHDHGWFCPRLGLSGDEGRYCGEPDLAGCERCLARRGSLIGPVASVAALRRRSATVLRQAAQVIVPGAETASRLRRHFTGLRLAVAEPEAEPRFVPAAPRARGIRRIVVLGAIGAEKGFHILRAAGQDAAERGLPMEFVLVGHSIDDAALLRTGRIFVTGRYAPEEAVGLVRAQNGALAFLPSVVPETWCYALSEAWRAGLHVAAFDLGMQAERIRRSGRGFLLPLALPAPALNDALLG